MAIVLDLQRAEDPRDAVHRAVQSLVEGQIVCLPTETVYSMAASAINASAVERLFSCMEGIGAKPALAVKSADEAMDYLCDASPLTSRFARQCWPGPVTLLTHCRHPDSAVVRLPHPVQQVLLGTECDIGLRVVKHAAVQSLLHYWSGPLVLIGMHTREREPITTGAAAAALTNGHASLILDDGQTRYGGPCTSVRIQGSRFQIVDHGVVEDDVIRQLAQPLILLVCTGNTCRSPMAEALLNQRLKASKKSERLGARVASAGLAAMEGERASSQAVEVLKRRGLDLSRHQSRCIDQSLLFSADLILTMTGNHAQAILRNFPQLADRVHPLRGDGGDVVDPIGGPLEVYESCAQQIDRELQRWVERLEADWLPVEES